MESLSDLKARMLRGGRRIQIFGGVVLFTMTVKSVLLLILVDKYDYWFFINLQIDLLLIVSVFVYSLCKIMKIARKYSIKIYKCYLFMHFISILFLILTWTIDFFFYVEQ